MVRSLLIVVLVFLAFAKAQSQSEIAAKKAVDTFFEHFHAQDTTALLEMGVSSLRLQSIQRKGNGGSIDVIEYANFVKSIGSIPASVDFKEVLLDYNVVMEDLMAIVMTPYRFEVNGQVSHCGMNVFTLVFMGGAYKIIHLTDTRGVCEE